VSLAIESAEQAEASANQVCLFGGTENDIERAPEYVKVPPWSEKQKLTEEKVALGFYLSGHLFNAYAEEAGQFARTKLANLEPARESRLIAGVIVAVRTQMTQRGKIMIVTLDDTSATVEVTVYNEVVEPNKGLFKEDEFLAVQGKVSEDRFSGGLRIAAEKVMDITTARIQFGRQFSLSLSTHLDPLQIKQVLAPYQSETGLPLLIRYTQQGVECHLRLSDAWRVQPADSLKQVLMDRLGVGSVGVDY